MPLPPSRRDNTGPPPRDWSDLGAISRHQGQSLRSRDPGYLDGHFATPSPVPPGSLIVGGDGGGEDCTPEWFWGDRLTVAAIGAQSKRLTFEPIEESLIVRWHPDARQGIPLTDGEFSVEDGIVSIPDPGVLVVGDHFSFQYQFDPCLGDALDLEVIGCIAGVGTIGGPLGQYLAFDLIAAGAEEGDWVIVACRGAVAPGGGDITFGFSCSDSRVEHLYSSTPPTYEAVYDGQLGGDLSSLHVDIVPNPSYTAGAYGLAVILRGVNGITSAVAAENLAVTGGTTPVIAGSGAIAVTWYGNFSFQTHTSLPPTGYTSVCTSPQDYASTAISYWFDPDGDTSPAGTWSFEGCLIVGLT